VSGTRTEASTRPPRLGPQTRAIGQAARVRSIAPSGNVRRGKALAADYRKESQQLTAERIPKAVILFVAFIGVAGILENIFRPEHFAIWTWLYPIEVALAAGLVLSRGFLLRRDWLESVNILVWSALACLVHGYSFATALPIEFGALATMCMMMGPALIIPWGAKGQCALIVISIAAFFLQLVASTQSPVLLAYLSTGVLIGGALSVLGAHTFDLYRFAIFCEVLRTEHESSIHRNLVAVAKEINERIGDAELLDHIASVARTALDCDWITIMAVDEAGATSRIVGLDGRLPSSKENLLSLEFSSDDLPLVRRVIESGQVEVSDIGRVDRATANLMTQWRARELRAIALRHHGKVIGIIVAGTDRHHEASGEWADQLLRGIAEHAAIAVHNFHLVRDLRIANSMKSEFLATMSHELRTPLHVVLGYTDLLSDSSFGEINEEQQNVLGRLRHNSLNLLELVEATLEAHRLEAGRTKVKRRSVDLEELIGEIRTDSGYLPRRPGVNLQWEMPMQPCSPHTDPTKLKIVLKNLIGNALKFTAHGSVRVRVTANEGIERLDLEVIDSGKGIPAEDMPHIFDMFRQVSDHGAQTLNSGVGLGLYIVKRFVEELGGRISATSKPGQGSTFRVELPMGSKPLGDSGHEQRELVA
jgi:signal transduction histidine kinase